MGEWLEKAVCLYLVLQILERLAARSDFSRYIRFFCGLCYLVYMIQPVIDLLGDGEDIWILIEKNTYEQQVEEWNEEMERLESLQEDNYAELYEHIILSQQNN